MKTTLPPFSRILIVAIVSVFALSSCSQSNQQAFQKRKYMPWFAQAKAKYDFKQKQLANEERVVPFSNEALVVENSTQLNEEKLPLVKKQLTKISERLSKPTFTKSDAVKIEINEQNQRTFREGIILEDVANDQKITQEESLLSHSSEGDTELLLMLIIAILLPPLAVFLLKGLEIEFWISVILTIIGWLPGVVYALYLLLVE